MEDDILEQYRREAANAMEIEATKRITESTDPVEEDRLRNLSLFDLDDLVPANMNWKYF